MSGTAHAPNGTKDFFISYRGQRRDWALWINWVVRSAGYSTGLMEEFPTGTTWPSQMRDSVECCVRLIPLFSAEYWDSGACREEFDGFWQQHMENNYEQKLLPILVEECVVPVIHKPLLRKPINDLERTPARQEILAMIQGITPLATIAPYAEPEPLIRDRRGLRCSQQNGQR